MSDEQTTQYDTGAMRSTDGEQYDFTSIPMIGLLAAARTAAEGGAKYGRFNYKRGFPAHTLVNRALRHLNLWCLGDRSEPHLAHAIWNAMAAEESMILHPELNKPHVLGPGSTLTEAVLAHLEAGDEERKRKREASEFADLANWRTEELPEVKQLLADRRPAALAAGKTAAPRPEEEKMPEGWAQTSVERWRHISGWRITLAKLDRDPSKLWYIMLDPSGNHIKGADGQTIGLASPYLAAEYLGDLMESQP